MAGAVVPWDGRDQEEQAELWYNAPLRAQNRQLEDENMRLKRLLREHGIPWSESVAMHPAFQSSNAAPRRRSSRLSCLGAQGQQRLPHLPVEVVLRIMHYALVAKDPIIDPLSKLNHEDLTVQEAKRGPQVAIGFLATCKAFYHEGRRILWKHNTLTFTNPESLRHFAVLDSVYRRDISFINLRIIARYYDDEKRTHRLSQDYFHPELSKSTNLKVLPRIKETGSMSRKGFHCYTWTQTIDFLNALRPPFDPSQDRHSIRPRLFPGLTSMRMDFVNFPEYFLPFSDTDLHEIAAHDLGCTLNELIVTGLPCCDVGVKAGSDLQGMVKDDGLFIHDASSFIQQKRYLKPLSSFKCRARVVRAWRKLVNQRRQAEGFAPLPVHAVPEETGHPTSTWRKKKTMWKRVPISRDTDERKWVEFDRDTGEPMQDTFMGYDTDSDAEVCSNCGETHGHHDWGDMDTDSE